MITVPKWTRDSITSVVALCAIAFALRAPGIYAQLPDLYWHDEINFVEGALRVGTGAIATASFGGYGHGQLTYYLLFVVFAVLFVAGRLVGAFHGADEFLTWYVTDPTVFFLLVRSVFLAASVGTVALTFLLARRLFGVRAAWIAGGLMAVSFQSVQITFGKEDGLYLFLAMLVVWCAVRMPAQTRWRAASLGGLVAAATAVKYFGVLLLPLVAGVSRRWVIAAGAFVVAFLCFMPGILFDTERFISSFSALATNNSLTDRPVLDGVGSPWYAYLWTSMAVASGPLLAFVCYVSACWWLWTRPRQGAALLLYPVLLLGGLTASLLFGRPAEALNFYQLSALPFLFIAVGGWLAQWPRQMTIPGVALLLLMMVPNVLDDLRFQRLLHATDSRTRTREWIEAHVPEGEALVVEGAIQGTLVYEGPQLRETAASLARTLGEIRANGGAGGLWSAKIRVAQGGYDVRKVQDITPADLGPAYAVVRNQRGRQIVEADGRYQLVFAVASAAPLFPRIPLLSSADITRLRRIPLFADDPQLTPGPNIRVYRLQGDPARNRTR